MDIKIHRSISEISEGAWDSIVDKNRVFCSYKYVETLEKSGLNKNNCYYPVVYNGNEIVAHTCTYLVTTEMDLFAQGVIKKAIQLVRKKWKNFFILRSLECGSPIAVGNVISFREGIDRGQALGLLCDGVEGLAKELRIKFLLLRDFYDKEVGFFDLLKARGYMKIHNLPQAEIKIRWKSFDEYLNSMRSNYRCKILKTMDKAAKANISFNIIKDFSDRAGELKRLYDNVYDQAKEVKRERLPESFFQNINKYLGEKVTIISAEKDNKLIGYMFLLFSGNTLITKFPGIDYNYNREYGTYFNLFYKSIELAINSGIDNIDMGITTLNPKKDMGSDIATLNMYMRHSNPLLNKIIPTLFDMITPPDTEGPRNVFK